MTPPFFFLYIFSNFSFHPPSPLLTLQDALVRAKQDTVATMQATTPRGGKGGALSLLTHSYTMSCAATPLCKDENGFAADCEKIREKIEDVKTPWTDRMDALKHLQSLILGGAAEHYNFRDIMSDKLRYPIVAQIGELRSQIVKEVCNCVMIICKSAPDAVWDEMSAWFVPALQKQLPVTVLAISSSVNQAIRLIISRGRLGLPCLKQILEGCRFKNKTRVRAYEHLFFLVHHVPVEKMLGPDMEALLSLVVNGMGDTDPIVRQLARLVYWGVERNTSKGQVLWGRLSDNQRKLISDEQSVYLSIDPELLQPQGESSEIDCSSALASSQVSQPPAQPARRPSTGTQKSTRSASGTRGRIRSRSVVSAAASSQVTQGPLTETRNVNTLQQQPPAKKALRQERRTSLPEPSQADVLDDLLNVAVKGATWEQRADAFSSVAGLASAQASGPLLGKAIEAALTRLPSEQHFKVITEILTWYGSVFSPSLTMGAKW